MYLTPNELRAVLYALAIAGSICITGLAIGLALK